MGCTGRFAVAVLGLLLGCGASVPYGSFITGSEAAQARMAVDAAGKLRETFPPEQHSLQFTHPADDPFGQALASELRGSGYSVQENYRDEAGGHRHLQYVVDELEGTNMLRVQLLVDARRFSRAYLRESDGLRPMGAWSSAGGAQ